MLSSHSEVHYFDPRTEFINKLKEHSNNNTLSHYNSFRLGNNNENKIYYDRNQSFLDRTKSTGMSGHKTYVIPIKKLLIIFTKNISEGLTLLK